MGKNTSETNGPTHFVTLLPYQEPLCGVVIKNIHNEHSLIACITKDWIVSSNLGKLVISCQSKCSFHLISTISQPVNLISILPSLIHYVTLHYTYVTESRK